jgi:hypothetical protein
MLPPLRGQRRLQRVSYFGAIARLQHLLPTLQEWCCRHPCKARFRLAGSPLPGGRRTLWITAKGFRSLILLFWIYPGATAMNSRRRIPVPHEDRGSLSRPRSQGNGLPSVFAALHEPGSGPSRQCGMSCRSPLIGENLPPTMRHLRLPAFSNADTAAPSQASSSLYTALSKAANTAALISNRDI